jgi:hypothetical protein
MSKKMIKCKFNVVEVQVRWERDDFEPANDCTFLYGKRNYNARLETALFVHKESSQQLRG